MRPLSRVALGSGIVTVGAWLGFAAFASAIAQPPTATALPAQASQAEEIVVTARRSGIPVWRVSGPRTTIVLVGSISEVARDTRWDPASLEEALRKADRVMFPQSLGLTGSPFSLVGVLLKWRKQATLPKGQSLAGMMSPEQFARLVALRNRGILKPGFERKHPFHLALMLHNVARGKRGYGPDVGQFVRRTAKKHKLKMVPIARGKAKPIVNEFFATTPQSHVPCLLDAVTLVEAGPGAIKARSDAWAERRVPDAIDSPVERADHRCWPHSGSTLKPIPELGPQVRRLLSEPQVTLAVAPLYSLAQPGGVLDDLKAAGFDVRGPRWKR